MSWRYTDALKMIMAGFFSGDVSICYSHGCFSMNPWPPDHEQGVVNVNAKETGETVGNGELCHQLFPAQRWAWHIQNAAVKIP